MGWGALRYRLGSPKRALLTQRRPSKIARQHGGPFQLMSCLTTLGWGYHNIERYAQMRDTFTECLHIAETIEARLFMGLSRTMIAFWVVQRKAARPGFALYYTGAARFARLQQRLVFDLLPGGLWHGSACSRRLGAARFLSPRALRSFDRIGTRWEVASGLIDCGVLACELEDWPCAAHLFAASEALRESINHPMLRSIECHYLPARARLQAELEPEVLRREWEHGRALSVEEALLEADKLAGPPPEALLPLTVWPPL
jgi:hypothetical protein